MDCDDEERDVLTIEELESIDSAPNIGGVGYHFIKIFRCKDGNRPFNATMIRVMINGGFRIQWYTSYGKTDTFIKFFLGHVSQIIYLPTIDKTIDKSSGSDRK